MTASRHHALKSQHLPPVKQTAEHHPFRLGSYALSAGDEPPINMPQQQVQQQASFPTGGHASTPSLYIQLATQATSTAHCTDNELTGYSDQDFETVNRVFELCFQRSLLRWRDGSNDASSQATPDSLSKSGASLVDKLTLIKSYEQTLRNQGLSPVEDSRIYRLLFRAVHQAELYLEQNKDYVKSREMASLERLSLLQNELHQLKIKSKEIVTSQPHHFVSCLTQPEVEEPNHQPSNSIDQQQFMEDPIKSQPALQRGPNMDTISQIGVVESPFLGGAMDYGSLGGHTPVNNLAPSAHAIVEESGREAQSAFQSTRKITKLELKPSIIQTKVGGHPEPNPVSDRQIDRQIVDLHLTTGSYYPSFDRKDADRSQFANESQQHLPLTLNTQTNLGHLKQEPFANSNQLDDRDNLMSATAPGSNGNLLAQFSNTQLPKAIQTCSSDAYIMTTEDKREEFVYQNNQYHPGGTTNISSIFINTNAYTDELRTQAENLSIDPSLPQVRGQSHSFCHDVASATYNGVSKALFVNTQQKQLQRDNSAQNRTMTQPQGSSRRYLSQKPPVDTKKTLTFKFKVQYSRLFRVFRGWSQHTSLRKRQKKLKKLLLNGLVKAIGKHEELLLNKTFKALKAIKKLNSKTNQKVKYIEAVVAQNIKAFYLKLMIKKQKELHFARNLTSLAQSHFKSCLRSRILEEMRSYARKRRDKLHKTMALIKRKPQSAIVLINFLGFNMMPKTQHDTFDILDFYSYCTIKKKYSPDGQRLARTIELSLKQQLRRIMGAWKDQKNQVVSFKASLRVNNLRRIFRALDKNCALNYRLRLYQKRRANRMQEQVIIALLQNLERVRRLGLAQQLTSNLHCTFQQRQFFSLWHDLHSFYKVGSLLKFSQKSTPLKALHLHKKRVFNRLVRYCKQKRLVKQLVKKHKQKNMAHLLFNSFKSWVVYQRKQKALNQRQAQVQSAQEAKVRSLFFNGMMRACMIRQRQRSYREYVLMAKGLQGLAQRVDYRRMQTQMKQICRQTYLINLVKKTFLGLKSHKVGKDNAHYMLVRARQFLAARSLHGLFNGWKDAVQAKKQRQLLAFEVERFYSKKILRKVYQTLLNSTIRQRHLASARYQIESRVQSRIYRSVMLQMICKYASRANLKQNQKDFVAQRNRNIEKHCYLVWLQRFRTLKVQEKHITQNHELLVKVKMFESWFTLGKEQQRHHFQINKILKRSYAQRKQGVFEEWRKYTERRVESRKLKMVSSFYFISKVLKKTIQALRMNSIHEKFAKANANQNAPKLMRDCFTALKHYSDQERKVRQIQDYQSSQKVRQLVHFWLGIAKKAKQSDEIIEFFHRRRLIRLQQRFFSALGTSGKIEAQMYYLGRVVRAWKRATKKHISLRQKQEQVGFVHTQLLKHAALREWRNAHYMQLTLKKIAIPYNRTICLKAAFSSLKKVTVQRRKAKQFNRHSMLFKAMQALTYNQMNQMKVKEMQARLKAKKMSHVFDAFIDQCLVEQDLRLKAEELKKRTEGLLRERSYLHWFNLCQERLHFQPIESTIKNEIREKWLLKVSFAAMTRFVAVKKGKKQMFGTILNFHKQGQMEKAFRKLAIYTERRAQKRAMNENAELFYCKSTFRKVISYALNLRSEKIQLVEEQRSRWLCIRALAAFRDNVTTKHGKKTAQGKADVFSAIRLKLNVFRALAINTLQREQARVKAKQRHALCLKVKSYATRQLLEKLNRISKSGKQRPSRKTKLIVKIRHLTMARSDGGHLGSRQVKSLTDLVRCARFGRSPRFTKARKQRFTTKKHRVNRKKFTSKIQRIKKRKSSSPYQETTPKISQEQMMIVMDDMVFEEDGAVFEQTQQEEEPMSMTVVQQRKERGPAVKSIRPPVVLTQIDSAPRAEATRQEIMEIRDLTRDEDSFEQEVIGIEECYEEDYETEERKEPVRRESLGIRDMHDQMLYVGSHLDQGYNPNQDQAEIVAQELGNSSVSFAADKWENFVRNQNGGGGISDYIPDGDHEENMHTMPSFREVNDDDCEKTLSVIYDDTDLARDPHHSFLALQQQSYVTQGPESTSPIRPHLYTPADSVEVTAEKPKRIMKHLVVPESPSYETNNEPSKQNSRKVPALHASNQEIEDEIAMYSTVQNYQHKKVPLTPNGGAHKSPNDWLKRTLQNRLITTSGPSEATRRSSSAKGIGPNLNGSLLSNQSLRSSQATRIAGTAPAKDNKVMQKIVENLSYLNLSREHL